VPGKIDTFTTIRNNGQVAVRDPQKLSRTQQEPHPHRTPTPASAFAPLSLSVNRIFVGVYCNVG
jgi:hypothetical protein